MDRRPAEWLERRGPTGMGVVAVLVLVGSVLFPPMLWVAQVLLVLVQVWLGWTILQAYRDDRWFHEGVARAYAWLARLQLLRCGLGVVVASESGFSVTFDAGQWVLAGAFWLWSRASREGRRLALAGRASLGAAAEPVPAPVEDVAGVEGVGGAADRGASREPAHPVLRDADASRRAGRVVLGATLGGLTLVVLVGIGVLRC